MGLDIRIKDSAPLCCPYCGEIVAHKDVAVVYSSGSDWYDYLEQVGYYGTDEDWYWADMVLTDKQAQQLASYAIGNGCYNSHKIYDLVARARENGHEVAINADW